MREALSVCLIVKNEENNLRGCLGSVGELASELVVVDTGSSDGTPQVAAKYGAKVLPFDFTTVDFAAARNHALAHAEGSWVLMLDADETLDPMSAPLVEKLAAGNENVGYYLERHNHSENAQTTSDWVVRLFPNRPSYRYRGRVHETIDGSILAGGGQLLRSDIRIHHNFSSGRGDRRRKNHWYIQILKEEIAANPGDHSRLDFLAAEYHQLEMFKEATEITECIAQARPLDPRAQLFAGLYHLLYSSDLKRARADFEEALKLKPGYAEAESFLQLLEERERR